MYDRILVPIADSPPAKAVLQFVQHLPARAIVLLHVEPNFQVLAPGPLSNFRSDWREVRAGQVRDELGGMRGQLSDHGAEVELEIRFSNDVAGEIIAMATDADLIVMATHGRGVGGQALFGSTADRVARLASIPVLLLRDSAETLGPVAPRRIVVPLDGSERAEAALPVAAKLAAALSLPVHLVRVLDTARKEPREQARSSVEEEAAAYLTGHVARLATEDIVADQTVGAGTPAQVLLDLLSPEDIVVMTSHGRHGMLRWLLGSVADKLVHNAVAPVLLVPSAGRGSADT